VENITLAHGNGGRLMEQLINDVFLNYFDNEILYQKNDSAILSEIEGEPVISTDSFVVNPIFFPGGDIGKLAICGTINDLAVSKATPLYISAGFILEEGFPIKHLKRVVRSMANAAQKANVKIVTGDTKVVEKGKGDKIYINTTGFGSIKEEINKDDDIKKGDKVIINGTIGEHGLTILTERKEMSFKTSIKSDCCILSNFIRKVLNRTEGIKFMRDPTRGGIATVLNEICDRYDVGININEEDIPFQKEVKSLCKMMGLDPLYLANEGKVILIVDEEKSEKIVEIMQFFEKGKQACIIGSINQSEEGQVCMKTKIGGKRIINKLIGNNLPRIC